MTDLQCNVYVFGQYRLDTGRRTLSHKGQPLPLTHKEFETLLVLAESGGEAVGKEAIVSRVWPDTFVGDSSLTRNISVLRRTLGQGVIETIPKFGYRLSPPVQVLKKEPSQQLTPAPFPSAVVLRHSWPTGAVARRFGATAWVAATLAIGLAVALGVYIYAPAPLAHLFRTSGTARVAVLPFLNRTGDSAHESLCDGLTVTMISELQRRNPSRLSVTGPASVLRYKATNKSAQDIGRELKVHYIVKSSVRTTGNRLRVSTELVRASDAEVIWTGEFERKLKDVMTMQQEMATVIARQISLRLSGGA